MKKLLLSFAAFAGGIAMAFAGTGTEADPFSVSEIVKGTATGSGVYVQGYIVGSVDGQAYDTGCIFGTNNASNTNVLLADSSAEDDKAFCIPVQLPSGDVRTALSLQAHPQNLGHQVLLKGNITTYFSKNGLKDTSYYKWIGTAPEGGSSSGGSSSGGSSVDTNGSLLINLKTQSVFDLFEVEGNPLPDGLSYVWAYDATYGAKASAYVNSIRYETDVYLISPVVALSSTTPKAVINQAINFLGAASCTIYVREVNTAWTAVKCEPAPAGNSWTFAKGEVDLSDFAGKEIQFGFRYQSTSTDAPTWEIDNIYVWGTCEALDNSDDSPSYGDGIVEVWDRNLLPTFPSGTNTAPTEPTQYTSTETGITYTIMGCYINPGYLFVAGKTYPGAYISWTLECPLELLVMTTTGGCSTKPESQVNVYANDNLIGLYDANVQNSDVVVEIPEEYQAAGTVYKVESNTTACNQQFAKFNYTTYAEAGGGVEGIVAADGEAVYFNLQGVKVANPDHGIFIKVQNGKSSKVAL